MKKSYITYILLVLSVGLNLYFALHFQKGLLYASDGGRDYLKQLNDKTYAENSTTEPLIGSPVQYFIFQDEKRHKVLYVFKYKDQLTSQMTDEE